MIEEATIIDGKVYVNNPNELEKYVIDCINSAVDRLKDHILVKEDPLKYVIKTILGYDIPHDPEWQPYARYAKDNLADTKTAMKFISNHYDNFVEVVNNMSNNFGEGFYDNIFKNNFDLVRLTIAVYHEIVDQIAHTLHTE